MRRKITDHIIKWMNSEGRKPLILRGARQVGKTWAIREAARLNGYKLVEINFERNPEYGELFLTDGSTDILRRLEAVLGMTIESEKCLLFLDEIQACSYILPKLRWFYEELPQLAVAAAGSLLEFTLAEHDFSMPVGRVTYMYMEPMTYIEFLWAMGEDKLADALADAREGLYLPDVIHKKALELFRQYIIIGGMPEVVTSRTAEKEESSFLSIQGDLIATFRDDFNKYRKRVSPDVLRYTLQSTAAQAGRNFKYSRVQDDIRQPVVKEALSMLVNARLCRKVYYTAANGIPLGAEIKEGIFKVVSLDTGLVMNILGLRPIDISRPDSMIWSNKGVMAEQVVGQLLLAGKIPHETEIYFWQQSGSGTGEIDYLIQGRDNNDILPIEVKAGAAGSMKSLHAFMEKKKLNLAYRFDSNPPSRQQISLRTNAGHPVEYVLISLPLYMAELL